jgi:hypothetical protein
VGGRRAVGRVDDGAVTTESLETTAAMRVLPAAGGGGGCGRWRPAWEAEEEDKLSGGDEDVWHVEVPVIWLPKQVSGLSIYGSIKKAGDICQAS